MKNAVIFGATSTIAEHVANRLGQDGYNLFLLARNVSELERLRTDLNIKYQNISIFIDSYDALADKGVVIHHKLENIYSQMSQVDLFLVAHGILPDQHHAEQHWDYALQTIEINSLSVMELCSKFAHKLENIIGGKNLEKTKQLPTTTIAVISSVAGLRGRQSNYVYGSAKGMLNVFLSGLRNRLAKINVNVLTILPGFVATKMTQHISQRGLLWANPQDVANDIVAAINKGKDVLYTKWFWKYIMLIICAIPERVFKKLKL